MPGTTALVAVNFGRLNVVGGVGGRVGAEVVGPPVVGDSVGEVGLFVGLSVGAFVVGEDVASVATRVIKIKTIFVETMGE
jgi:hypothetical protein